MPLPLGAALAAWIPHSPEKRRREREEAISRGEDPDRPGSTAENDEIPWEVCPYLLSQESSGSCEDVSAQDTTLETGGAQSGRVQNRAIRMAACALFRKNYWRISLVTAICIAMQVAAEMARSCCAPARFQGLWATSYTC